ncbi:MAG TPA: FMN-binding negative transcriptional regulator [Ramlibacter sp.]|nr:FMN-binding negative transcriptional regulator [Ramlibacter sp.]
MYLSDHFAEPRVEELQRIMRDFPLGTIVTHTSRGLDANHIPLELDAGRGACGTLQGHIARANPLWTEVPNASEVLVIFQGHNGYISPSWYPSKQETHRHVPTWNYEVVHARGRLRIIDDESFVRGVVARLTRRHEAAEPRPWKMGDAPADYLEQMLKVIVGIEVEISHLEGKRKLGQNRDARDLEGAVRALRERGQNELASAMAGANLRS